MAIQSEQIDRYFCCLVVAVASAVIAVALLSLRVNPTSKYMDLIESGKVWEPEKRNSLEAMAGAAISLSFGLLVALKKRGTIRFAATVTSIIAVCAFVWAIVTFIRN